MHLKLLDFGAALKYNHLNNTLFVINLYSYIEVSVVKT